MRVRFVGNPHREDHERDVPRDELHRRWVVPRPVSSDTMMLTSPNWKGAVGWTDVYEPIPQASADGTRFVHYRWIEGRR